MSERVGFSTSTTISISLSSVFSPRATEPKITEFSDTKAISKLLFEVG